MTAEVALDSPYVGMKPTGSALLILLSLARLAHGDLTLRERVFRETGDRKAVASRVVSIAGTRMRVDEAGLDSTIYDASAGHILRLGEQQKTGYRSAPQDAGGTAPLSSEWTATGRHPGPACTEYRFRIRVPVEGALTALVLTGTARITDRDAADYILFQRAVEASHLVLWSPADTLVEDPQVARALARGRTELGRKIAEAGGRPCEIELRYHREQAGLRRLLDKTFSGALRLEVREVARTPLDPQTFEPPPDFEGASDESWSRTAPDRGAGRIHLFGRHLWLGLGAGASALSSSASQRAFGSARVQPVIRLVGPPDPGGLRLSIAPVFKHFSKGDASARLIAPTAGLALSLAKRTSDWVPIAVLRTGAYFLSRTGSATYLRPGADLELGLAFKARLALSVGYEAVAPARNLDLSSWSCNLIVRAY